MENKDLIYLFIYLFIYLKCRFALISQFLAYLSSMRILEFYQSYENCSLMTSKNILHILDFDLGPSSTCATDFVEFSTKDSDGQTRSLGKFCGGDRLGEITNPADTTTIR